VDAKVWLEREFETEWPGRSEAICGLFKGRPSLVCGFSVLTLVYTVVVGCSRFAPESPKVPKNPEAT
jgi:hypothetical protein